ncbi:MAG: hypothetical protein HQK52_16525 [Oligoflexia bacterium]|nr:hypothetical protein [Oligoflexia bacterium]
MANAAILGKTRPGNISFKATYDIIDANKSNLLNTRGAEQKKVLATMFYQMLTVKVGKRGSRMEHRAVKKRAKPHKRLTQSREEWKRNLNA